MSGQTDLWPQSPLITKRLAKTHSVSEGLNWDCFIGPAQLDHTIKFISLITGEVGGHLEAGLWVMWVFIF